MATSARTEDEVEPPIECSLCLSIFRQPKCLPCIHTFCKDCLQEYVDQNATSDELPCPLCRHMFPVRLDLSLLPDNFRILNLIELARNSGAISEESCNDVKLLVAVGLHDGKSTEQKICEICLDKPDTVPPVISSIKPFINVESAVCVVSNVLYAVGLGRTCKELWKWSGGRDDEWQRCKDMSSGRRKHGVTSVGDKIYVLGGWASERALDSILCYDINSNEWTEAGQLCYAVYFPTCEPYEHCVYAFGGRDQYNRSVNAVQVFDTTTGLPSLGIDLPPCEYYMMRSVLWRSKAILIGWDNCFIYDFELRTCDERKRFRTHVVNFGLTLDNNTLYISGGSTTIKERDGVWTCRDDVESLLVDDFISDNEDAKWNYHATLPTPSLVMAHNDKPLYVTRLS